MNKKMILSMALAGGILLSPSLAQNAFSQNDSPRCPGLEALNRGNALGLPGTSEQRRLEKALRQNMQSAQVLMRAAKKAGASKETLGEMGKMSANFMKLFVDSISQCTPPRDAGPQVAPPPPPPAPKRPIPVKPAQPRAQQPAPQAQQPVPPIPPQGLIITAPDGTQWLVTPQQQPGQQPPAPQPPRAPKMMPPQSQPVMPGVPVIPPVPPTPGSQPVQPGGQPVQPGAQQPPVQQPASPALPEGVIILEEETVGDLPKWPTKDQYAEEGMLKYVQMLNAQEKGMPVSEDMQFVARATPNGLVIVGEEMEEDKPVWPTKDQYAEEGMLQYVEDLKAEGK